MTEAAADRNTVAESGPVGRALEAFGRLLAVVGGVVLVGLAVMETASVSLRALAGAPIAGDFELVQLGTALAVFFFLPYCQLRKGNFIVDFVTKSVPPRTKAVLDALGGLLLATIAALLAWRMALGALDLHTYREKTVVLEIMIWALFPPILLALALLVAVSLYSLWRDLRTAAR